MAASRSAPDSPTPLTPHQHDLACALLLTDASVSLTGTGDSGRLTVTSDRKDFVDWIDSHFGTLGWVDTAEETTARYTWQSHPHTEFARYYADWTRAGDVVVPAGYTPSPTVIRLLYARAGECRTVSGTRRVVFDESKMKLDSERAVDVLSDFHPLQFDRVGDDGSEVYLEATEEFFEYIQPVAVPGYEDNWPRPYRNARVSPDGMQACSSCGIEVTHLAAHWQSSPHCNGPSPEFHHHETLAGVMLAGGRVREDEYGVYLEVESDNYEYLAALDDEFGALSRGVTANSDASTFRWQTRSNPAFDSYAAWEDPAWGSEDSPAVPADLTASPRMLKAVYALTSERRGPVVSIDLPVEWPSEKFAREFFERFDPIVEGSTVELYGVSKFFSYIGLRPPAGCTAKWPSATETQGSS